MAFIDTLSKEEIVEIANVLALPAYDKEKTSKIDEFISKYGMSKWWFYKAKQDIMDKAVGARPALSKTIGTSTLLDASGNVKLQWVKEQSVDKVEEIRAAIMDIVGSITDRYKGCAVPVTTGDDLLPVYISNDVHIGALMWGAETMDRDWDLPIAEEAFKRAIDTLIDRAPASKECIVADLGDLTEIDDLKNMTPKSGHVLDTDGRYPKVIKVAMECMKYFVEKALTKHEIVRFYNISGNHDTTTGYAITAFMAAWFRNEPRVIVDESPAKQKYFKFGRVMLGFAHGDGLKMRESGEVMAMHNPAAFSETSERFFHFGHIHKDAVYDGRLCKAESHRNLAPLNAWASDNGFGRNAGTMKCIVYSREFGEDTRITYNIRIGENS